MWQRVRRLHPWEYDVGIPDFFRRRGAGRTDFYPPENIPLFHEAEGRRRPDIFPSFGNALPPMPRNGVPQGRLPPVIHRDRPDPQKLKCKMNMIADANFKYYTYDIWTGQTRPEPPAGTLYSYFFNVFPLFSFDRVATAQYNPKERQTNVLDLCRVEMMLRFKFDDYVEWARVLLVRITDDLQKPLGQYPICARSYPNDMLWGSWKGGPDNVVDTRISHVYFDKMVTTKRGAMMVANGANPPSVTMPWPIEMGSVHHTQYFGGEQRYSGPAKADMMGAGCSYNALVLVMGSWSATDPPTANPDKIGVYGVIRQYFWENVGPQAMMRLEDPDTYVEETEPYNVDFIPEMGTGTRPGPPGDGEDYEGPAYVEALDKENEEEPEGAPPTKAVKVYNE